MRSNLSARTLALAALVLLTAACDSVTVLIPDTAPTRFRLRADAWSIGADTIGLRGDTLVVVRVPSWRPDSIRTAYVVPTRADWQAFWSAADAAGVMRWPLQCSDPNIVDGGGFSLEITYERGSIRASGVNSYPRRDGTCSVLPDVSADYRTFMDAVSRLVGRKFPFGV